MIFSVSTYWLILKIIGQCDVEHIMMLPIKTMTSDLKILTYIITSIATPPTWHTSGNVCLNLRKGYYLYIMGYIVWDSLFLIQPIHSTVTEIITTTNYLQYIQGTNERLGKLQARKINIIINNSDDSTQRNVQHDLDISSIRVILSL
jgi:hypothetical protein